MPIGTVTMILANVGMQIYNNWCNGRQNEQLQQMREEFEQAARERQTERMWQLMREGQELTMQLEEEKHQQRIDELKNDVGDLLLKLAYENAINNWPLNVLPIVMKNQALGNLLANQEESIALHCILTPSNCPDFNKYVYSAVEKELEQYCNLYWSSNSVHPILFYSGAWRGNEAPTGVQIESMRTALSNLPTLLITPFFRPSDGNLVIQLRIWGVGAASNDNGMLSDLYEFEPSEKEFQREYNKQLDFASEEGLIEDLVEDLVPYLQCLIGYMADTYFWSSSGLAPLLPHLLMDGSINTDGMKYLVNNSGAYYEKLLQSSEENVKKQPFVQDSLLNLYEGGAELWEKLWDEETRKKKLTDCLLASAYSLTGNCYSSILELCSECNIRRLDIEIIDGIDELLRSYGFLTEADVVRAVKSRMESDKRKGKEREIEHILTSDILNSTDTSYLKELAKEGDCVALYRLGEIFEYSIGNDIDTVKSMEYYEKASAKGFVLAILKIELLHFLMDGRCDSQIIKDNVQDLQEMVDKGITQAIIMAVAFSFYELYSFVDKEDLLTTLDIVEYSEHPYAYYLGAMIIMKYYGREYIGNIISLLDKSSEIGYVKATLELADIYRNGTLTSKSAAKFIEYSKKAAKKGSSEALTNIGYCFATGFGVQKSKSNAMEYFQMAAELGDRDAIQILNGIKE